MLTIEKQDLQTYVSFIVVSFPSVLSSVGILLDDVDVVVVVVTITLNERMYNKVFSFFSKIYNKFSLRDGRSKFETSI